MTITTREWRSVAVWAAVLMALTTLPYIACAAAGGDDWVFGGNIIGAEDGNSYLSKMRQGARGDWLFHIAYTGEPHDGALLFLPYILLGKVAALFADPGSPAIVGAMAAVFHAARVISGFALVLVVYRFAAAYLRSRAARLAATVIITAGGGLGWLLQLAGLGDWLGSQPVDFFIPEGYTYMLLYALPHMSLARALMLGGLLLMLGPSSKRGSAPRKSILAGLCWAGMGLCVPFYIAVIYAILGAWGLGAWLRTRRFPWALFWHAVTAGLVTLPVLLYTAYHFAANEVFSVWSAQNDLPSPHPAHYVFGYVALAIPAVWGAAWAWRKGRPRDVLLVAWVVVAPVMVYLPIKVQRRLAEGVFVPLAILAVAGLRGWAAPRLARWLKRRRRGAWRVTYGAALALLLPTSALLLMGGAAQAIDPSRPVFHPRAEIDAMNWLAANAPRDAVVIGAFGTGNYLPARADVRAFLGLGPETVHSDEKRETVRRFFAGEMGAAEVEALYAASGIDYVFYGPEEGAAERPSPAWADGLKVVYDQDGYTIYEVP
jgi:hypothetical protein